MPRDSKYHQGRFHPQNPQKYMGDARNIVYRSSWELHFLKWCDRNDAVLKYASEEFSIPYVSPVDNKVHRYYPDFIIKVRQKDGGIKTIMIEIKPEYQKQEPKVQESLPEPVKVQEESMPKPEPAVQPVKQSYFKRDPMTGFFMYTP